ncbi:cation transporter [Candidatus Pacearchaeota archaeon CG10_big_fil_rev_8_21_14_0_10_31_24]|nr:MAG: cation transporter [Candidatus Pacearchaeota archaeon CG10_big_fil_rev_8_21_14_0_10_31_24]
MVIKKKSLTSFEANKKLKQYGYNEIQEKIFASPLKIFLRQIKNNYLIYLLLIASIISFFVHEKITAYTILIVIVVVVTIGFLQEYRAERVIKSLKSMIMPISILIRDEKEKEIPSREIVPGDIIILRNGEKIPADCILIEQQDVLMNESILTGESKAISKEIAKNESNYTEKNLLFAGSFIVNGRCTAKVIHTGMNTKFGKISGLIATAEKKLVLQEKLNHLSKYMVFVAIIFSILTGLLIFAQEDYSKLLLIEVLILLIALAVSAFPEGLPVVLITALSYGANKMAKKNAIMNRISAIETIGETTVICADKTGTITTGEMTVVEIFQDYQNIKISGAGYKADGEFTINNNKINPSKNPLLINLMKASVLCNDSRIERIGTDSEYRFFGTPTESALLIMAAKANIHKDDLKCVRTSEISFNSERKLMSTLCKEKNQNYVYAKGAPEIILNKCKYIQRNNGIFSLTKKDKNIILKENNKMTCQTLRTLAIAYKKSNSENNKEFEKDLVFMGLVGMTDPAREEVKESIQICLNSGIKVQMITGDYKETALAIAKQIGLKGKLMTGDELDKITEEELSKIVNEITIFARVKPEHKLKIVKALKANGEIVAMTGDGVNDAPALKEAHVGIAMGINGTDISRAVADMTLKDDNFSTIVEAIREGRTILQNIKKFTSYQFSCNFSELLVIFVGVLLTPIFGWSFPLLLALQILFMNLVTDDLPAITLAFSPSQKNVMTKKLKNTKELINKPLLIWTLTSGIIMAILTLLTLYVSHNILNQEFELARTTALLALILLEITNAYNFLSFTHRTNFKSLFLNKYLLYASLTSIALTILIIYTPLNKVFGTIPLNIENWGIALIAPILLILIFNILKTFNNKKKFLELE